MASRPTTTDANAWHAYIRSAPSFVESQDRMDEAVSAGVDFVALSRLQ